MSRFTLTRAQHRELTDTGVLRLPGFYPRNAIDEMAEALWADLTERLGARPGKPESWPQGRAAHFQKVERRGAFAAIASPDLRALADELLGRWGEPNFWGQALVTFPNGKWDVPHSIWHLDHPAEVFTSPLPMIRFFTLLAPVQPRGAATVYIEGSHKVVEDLARSAGRVVHSAEAKTRLKREERWFGDLMSLRPGEDRLRFMQAGGTARGFPVRVCEMIGEPGDMILMHPGMFHSLCDNALDNPRMALVQGLYRR